MSSLALYLAAGSVPSGTQLPSNAQALVAMVAQYVGIAGASNFNGLNYGNTTPTPANRGLPWFKTDAYGNPLGFYSWNGAAWVAIPTVVASGTTAARPATPSSGQQYWDTTIQTLIIWNSSANNWTTASGSVGDIKEVDTPLLSTALTNNPGWQQHTTSSGCVIAGSDVNTNGPATAHAQGTLIGEEAHTLSVAELASHTHPEAFAAFTGAFQNGPQASGVYTAITPGTTGLPVSNTATTGSSSAHNTIQPTYYTWRLKKMY